MASAPEPTAIAGLRMRGNLWWVGLPGASTAGYDMLPVSIVRTATGRQPARGRRPLATPATGASRHVRTDPTRPEDALARRDPHPRAPLPNAGVESPWRQERGHKSFRTGIDPRIRP